MRQLNPTYLKRLTVYLNKESLIFLTLRQILAFTPRFKNNFKSFLGVF